MGLRPPCYETSVRFGFRFGKRVGDDKLTQRQRAIIEQLEAGELTAEEAERRLGGAILEEWRFTAGDAARDETKTKPKPAETEDEATARELVERIAREVDEEIERESR